MCQEAQLGCPCRWRAAAWKAAGITVAAVAVVVVAVEDALLFGAVLAAAAAALVGVGVLIRHSARLSVVYWPGRVPPPARAAPAAVVPRALHPPRTAIGAPQRALTGVVLDSVRDGRGSAAR
jgi:hypothetical protein